MSSIFTPEDREVGLLDSVRSTTIFRGLLWAEADKLKIPKTKIQISILTTVSDEGIDALVDYPTLPKDGLIIDGQNGFQIKSGEEFKPWQKFKIRKELYGTKTPNLANLSVGIKECLDKNGRYVLVCYGHQITSARHRDAIKNLKDYLKKAGYKKPKVDVWGQDKIVGYIKSFPSLVMDLKGIQFLLCRTHKSWSNDADMRKILVENADYKQKKGELQNILRKKDSAKHVRILGEAGVGKTRFVLEATRDEDIKPLVIYTKANSGKLDELISYILREDNDFHVVLVVDECNFRKSNELWNQLQSQSSRIKLITIYNDTTETKEYDIIYPEISRLSLDDVKKIIASYGIPTDSIDRWAKFVGNSARLAHMIGLNLKNNSDDITRPVQGFYDRMFVEYEDPQSQEVMKRRKILRYIALFQRFGFKGRFAYEGRIISNIINKNCPDITFNEFQRIVKWFISQKILQGDTTLYISTPLIHVRMWKEWWENYGDGFNIDEFLKDIPIECQLRGWFYEMYKYAAESGNAVNVVKKLLGKEGPFQRGNYFEKQSGGSSGEQLFLNLATADPESSLVCLEKTIGTWNKDKLLQFDYGRREVVWSLEKIVIHKDLFSRAAELLLSLGEAENESFSNNASGVFAGLFSVGSGRVAPTEASPEERFPVLVRALESKSKERRLLALKACAAALESQYFIRFAGAEEQGLREVNLWKPKSHQEIIDSYKRVLDLIISKLDSLPKDESSMAAKIILDHARGLMTIPKLTNKIVEILNKFSEKSYATKEELLSTVMGIMEFEKNTLLKDTFDRLNQLKTSLTGNDFHSLMERYVGMDIMLDMIPKDGKVEDLRKNEIENLAEQALNSNMLIPELSWLVTTKAKNGYIFGYELGKKDRKFELFPTLFDAQREAGNDSSVFFLGGYFRAIFEKDHAKWESELERLVDDKKLNKFIPELTWRSGLTDKAGLLVLDIVQKGIVDFKHLAYFKYGSAVLQLSEDIFGKWVNYLLGCNDSKAIFILLDLYHVYYVYRKTKIILPKELTFAILTHEKILKKSKGVQFDTMNDFYWTEIGKAFVKHYPRDSLALAEKMLEHYDADSFFGSYGSQTAEVLNEIGEKFPIEVWKLSTKYLGPPIDSRALNIEHWLRGGMFESGKSILEKVPPKEIWIWVDADVDNHAWYLASFVPPKLNLPLVKEILVRYGKRKDVQRNLLGNFQSGVWTGPMSSHFDNKKQELLAFRQKEKHPNVREWIDFYISILKEEISQAKESEEREF